MAAKKKKAKTGKSGGTAYPAESYPETAARLDSALRQYKSRAETNAGTLRAGPVKSGRLLQIYGEAYDCEKLILDTQAYSVAHPEFLTYLNDSKGVTDADALLRAVRDRAKDVSTWVADNFPTGGQEDDQGQNIGPQNFLLSSTLGERGPEDRSFGTAQTADLATALDAFVATIDTTN